MTLDRTTAPPTKAIETFTLAKPQTITLKNGIIMQVVRAGVQPILGIQLSFQAGAWFAPTKEIGFFTNRMLAEGTKNNTSQQISEAFEFLGSHLELSYGMDYAHLDFYCLNKHLAQALDLVTQIITEPTFPEQELAKLKQIQIDNLKVAAEKTSVIASNLARQKLFGTQHPYGSAMTEEAIEQTNTQHLREFFQKAYYQQPFMLIVAGLVEDQHIELLSEALGNLPIAPQNPKGFDTPTQARNETLYQERQNASQTSIRICKKIFGRQHPDFIALSVLNEIFGGYFGSRLMQNIREEKGYTYGIYSILHLLRHDAYMTINADVQKEFYKEAIAEVYKEIEKLKTQNVEQEELTLVKNYMKGAFVGGLTTPLAIAERYKSLYVHQLPEDYYDHYFQEIDRITPEKIRELAQQIYTDEWLEVAVG